MNQRSVHLKDHSQARVRLIGLTGLTGLIIVVASIASSCQRGSDVEMAAAQTSDDSVAPQLATGNGESTAGSNYTVFNPALSMGTDAPGRLELRVTPRGGFKVNTEYPWLMTISPPDSLTVEQREWDVSTMERLTEDEALMAIPVSARAAGQYQVDGHLRFSVCNDVRCDTPQASVVWSVTVE